MAVGAVRDSGRWRCCPGWSTRTPTSSCRGCAAGCRRPPTSPAWVRQLIAARGGAVERPDDPGGHSAALRWPPAKRVEPAPRRSATSATRWRQSTRCCRERHARRWCSTSCSGSRRRPARWSNGVARTRPRAKPRRAVRGSRLGGAARAVLGLARAVPGHPRRSGAQRRAHHVRARRRVAGGGGVAGARQRPMGAAAAAHRRVARGLGGARAGPGRVPGSTSA